MRIGELAQKSGVGPKTIRYYEEIGVLPDPEREPNGYRRYGSAALERLGFVRDARATGLSLAEIGSILSLRDQGEPTCHHVLGLLEAHVEELDAHIASLQETRRHLKALTTRAQGLDPAECTDPNRCQTISGSRERGNRRTATKHLHGAPHAHDHS